MNSDNLPNNVYYDANIINNDQSGKNPPQLVFQDIRSTAILTYPQLYELSVVDSLWRQLIVYRYGYRRYN